MTFSPDGNLIYYIVKQKNSTIGELYRVPTVGGTSEKLLVNVDSPVTPSPDGKQLAFIRRYPSQREDVLIAINADGTDERQIASRKHPDLFAFNGPAWSPDEKIIAASVYNSASTKCTVAGIRVEDGAEVRLTNEEWGDVGQVAWSSDNSVLVFSAKSQGGKSFQLWQLSHPGGEVRRVTNDTNDYRGVSLARDAAALVTIQHDRRSNVWVSDAAGASLRRITNGKYDGHLGLAWTPQKQIVYVSSASGSPNIWSTEAGGSAPRQLTRAGGFFPTVSPDGRYIVYVSGDTSVQNIWRMDIDGGNPKQLASEAGESAPSISPDGRWVVYTSAGSNRLSLWKISIDGGEAVRLTDRLSLRPVISPDGSLIACAYRATQFESWKLALIPFEGGSPVKTLDIPRPFNQLVHWSHNGRSLLYIDTRDGVSNLWSQSLDENPPTQTTNFTSELIFHFDFSPDGNQITLARGARSRDIVLLTDFK